MNIQGHQCLVLSPASGLRCLVLPPPSRLLTISPDYIRCMIIIIIHDMVCFKVVGCLWLIEVKIKVASVNQCLIVSIPNMIRTVFILKKFI